MIRIPVAELFNLCSLFLELHLLFLFICSYVLIFRVVYTFKSMGFSIVFIWLIVSVGVGLAVLMSKSV